MGSSSKDGLPDLCRVPSKNPPLSAWKGNKKMSKKFIVVGPIEGFYHIAYAIPRTTLYESIMQFSNMNAALEVAADMNGEQDTYDHAELRVL